MLSSFAQTFGHVPTSGQSMHKLLLATLLLLLLSRSSQHSFLTSSPAKVMPMVLGLPVSHKTLCTSRRRKAFSQGVAVVAGFGEDIRKALDSLAFERWAPRSSRAWRLGGDPISRQRDAAAGGCMLLTACSAIARSV